MCEGIWWIECKGGGDSICQRSTKRFVLFCGLRQLRNTLPTWVCRCNNGWSNCKPRATYKEITCVEVHSIVHKDLTYTYFHMWIFTHQACDWKRLARRGMRPHSNNLYFEILNGQKYEKVESINYYIMWLKWMLECIRHCSYFHG